jgi:hypothetical protein
LWVRSIFLASEQALRTSKKPETLPFTLCLCRFVLAESKGKSLRKQVFIVMRSNLIFGAMSPVKNRYMLCQLVSKATRKFHRPATRVQDTMNDVLHRFAATNQAETVMVPGSIGSAQRKAA